MMIHAFSVNILSLLPLAEMTLGEKLVDAATVTIVGMGTVLVALGIIGEFFTRIRQAFIADVPDDPQTTAAKSTVSEGAVDPRLVAVISAAAMAATGRRVVLRRITFLNTNTVSGWAEAGRTSIHSSHNLRRNR